MTRDPGGWRALPGGGLPALYPGICCICHLPYSKGDGIAKRREKYAHAACHQRSHE